MPALPCRIDDLYNQALRFFDHLIAPFPPSSAAQGKFTVDVEGNVTRI
ncbi:hypothetical protein ACFV2H_45795 [Streptomyces sp. NPDC059629]